ncbi:MAG TPA: Sua5/YciO/YrdC/YwlC family protein [Candidatus Thermoplasmatota archaeon]|nr:Sua5/YciO/YrdC/YwlC family protein [Candidatus Thermoplasmatota archaeon]
MTTTVLPSDEDAVARAVAALDAGGLVMLPGDLRYLVAADALDDAAIERLFSAKARAADRALTVVLGGVEDLHHVAYGGAPARALAEAHWPGPTSLVLRARPWLPDALTAAQEEVAACVPASPFARDVARRFGPLAVAAARRSGAPEARTVEEAQRALGAAVALYVDGGALPGGEAKVIRAGEVARS